MTDIWDLSPLFSSDTDPAIAQNLKSTKAATQAFVTKWQSNPEYLSKPEVLKTALDEYESWARNFGISGHAGFYFHLRLAQDQANVHLKARVNQITESSHALLNQIAFFTLRLAKIPPNIQTKFLSTPSLASYKHFLEQLFAQAKYQLSEPEEKILVLKSQPAHASWVRMTQEFLSQETRDGKTLSDLLGLLRGPDKPVRDQAAMHINDILKTQLPVAEHELNSILADKKIDDTLRGLPRPDSARHLSDDIDTQVVDTLIKAVTAKFSVPQRFYELKAKLLGLPKLAYHERAITYGNINIEYPFDQSVQLVQSVFTSLDPQIGNIFHQFATSGTFDVYPHVGKKDGAFCSVDLITKPTYILLNHTNKFEDVLTLAHESGHGVNNELMRPVQNALNFGTPLSTAEVASTFFEDFVLQKLAETADDETKLAIMVKKLDDDVSTIFRQIAFYNFETELHAEFRKQGYLSSQQIGELFQKHMMSYMGNFVEQSPGSTNWWVYVSHFRSFFYVYSYASGLLISKSLQNLVKASPKNISNVKEFLSAGQSASPKDIFAKLGVDISGSAFWDQGLHEIETLLDHTQVLAKKLKKL